MNIDDITEEIDNLERSECNWANVQKLSWLYTVRDHIKPTGQMPMVGGSEFMGCTCGKDIGSVMMIMDELMEATQVLNPRLYEGVLMRLNEL